jgi:hypothetical protein
MRKLTALLWPKSPEDDETPAPTTMAVPHGALFVVKILENVLQQRLSFLKLLAAKCVSKYFHEAIANSPHLQAQSWLPHSHISTTLEASYISSHYSVSRV